MSTKNVTWKWLVGILITLLLMFGSYAAASLKDRTEKAHEKIDKLQESKVDIERYNCDMSRFEKKLDALIALHTKQ